MEDHLSTELKSSLPALIERFYGRVRQDPQLGPVFNGAVEDWDHHLALLVDFWSSVMLGTRTFHGNPMQAHLKHAGQISSEMFGRWLQIWGETTSEVLSPEAAAAMQAKAARIGQSLDMALHYRPDRPQRRADSPTPAEPTTQPSKPYRSTPVFTNQTLPLALKAAHNTRAGVWGVIRVLEGCVRYQIEDEGEARLLSPGVPGFVLPEQRHHVEPMGEMRMQVEFYDHPPRL
jgi:hemoglobin